jgi:phasin family protein
MTKKVNDTLGEEKIGAHAFEAAVKAGKDGVDLMLREGTDTMTKSFKKFVAIAQEATEGASKRYDDIAAFGRKGVEAGVAAADILVRHFETVNAQFAELSHRNLSEAVNATQSILAAKNPQEAAQIQIELAQSGFSRLIDQGTKFSEMLIKAANETFAPINSQISQFVERFTRSAA